MHGRSVCLLALLAFLVPDQSPADVTYTVQRGDTIERLARRLCPDYASDPFGCQQRIAAANNIRDLNYIRVGDELVIPGVDGPATALPTPPAPPDRPPSDAPATSVPYVVQSGDTIDGIADAMGDRFGVAVDPRRILAANGITDPVTLQPGAVITVPVPEPRAERPAPVASASAATGPSFVGLLGQEAPSVAAQPASGPGSPPTSRYLTGDAGTLADAGFVKQRRGESEDAATRRAVRRLYQSATYNTLPSRARIEILDDGNVRVTNGRRDYTEQFRGWFDQIQQWNAEARERYGNGVDNPSQHSDFARWIDEAANELTAYRPRLGYAAEDERRALVKAVLLRETSGGAQAVSPAGAIGVSQLMMATAQSQGVNPFDPRENLLGSARYLNSLISRFGDVTHALAYYNAGENTGRGQGYAASVLASQRRYLAREGRRTS